MHGHKAETTLSYIFDARAFDMELVNVRDALTAEAMRWNGLAKAARPRHESAMSVVRADR